ncbi:MAG: DNA-directed RNA polymerase subunit beta [Alphaproteobacteria bacterium ADurb.Bin438]|nr:MAG: DNA-directed RNA polymerase subunit beta [Alphaproteobacteria bacterium ADurb.Bin438]
MKKTSFTGRKRVRKNFGRIQVIAEMPNLIEVQKSSYNQFLQVGTKASKRTDTGLQDVFKSIFPIKDFLGRGELEFVKYELDEPKFDVEECLKRGVTFSAPLKATLRLVVWDIDEDTKARSIRDIKEQEVYMGDIPLMTENGTFVVNGTERVIVSQMHRSPGVFFNHDGGKTHSSGKYLFNSRIIPYRGSWLDFEFDAKDLVYVKIDRRRKLPITTLLYALDNEATEKARLEGNFDIENAEGMSREEILSYFYKVINYKKEKAGFVTSFVPERYKGVTLKHDLVDADNFKSMAKAGEKLTIRALRKLKENGFENVLVTADELAGHYSAYDIIDEKTGIIKLEAGDEISSTKLEELLKDGATEIAVLDIDHVNVGPYIRNTLLVDSSASRDDALREIYKIMRPGEPPTLETADSLFRGLFFDIERYDLSTVGRVKMNARLDISNEQVPDTYRVLRKDDILRIIKILVDLKDGRGEIDDIDHLGNRRVRSVGELMENQYRIGLLRMERAIKERMSSVDIDTIMPHDLVNAKPAAAAVREFFGSSQLSQFMDQTNPLAEITHKRRVSALGPGGLTRERAGFEVRDVHPTHYGRICPIETPEGQNIGLINSLSTYAKINQYGFIESPYRKITEGKLTKEVVYLSAMEEGKYTIAQANAEVDSKGKLASDLVLCRRNGDLVFAKPEEVDFIDVSPRQLVSVAAALIPFLENDDANRALMGSNMQRQAVPLLTVDAPYVGTGMEAAVGRDSGAAVSAKRGGIVQQVDARRIVIKVTDEVSASDSGVDIYNLSKFQRSNQSSCMNQRPIVKVGDVVKAKDIIADGPSTELGELALGRNVLCAFMSWNGYNYEDSILISERIVSDDVFTSIHIDEYEVMARDTKLGQEEITRDIPNVGEENLKNLDEAGIIYIGSEVKPGDILVGKVTPKGESPMTPEEKLLRAIFGEKAADVKDTSLRVPPGVSGTVVEVRVFNRRGIEKDERSKAIEMAEIERLAKDRNDEKIILERAYQERLKQLLIGQKTAGKKSEVITEEYLANIGPYNLRNIAIEDDAVMAAVEELTKSYDERIKAIQKRFDDHYSFSTSDGAVEATPETVEKSQRW